MKSLKTILAITILAIITLALTLPAAAKDLVLESTIQTMTVKNDKNGNEYVRFLIPVEKSLNGIAYTTTASVMCFSETAEMAKTYKEGDKFKAIVAENEYQGRMGYNLLAFVKLETKK